MVDNPLIVFLIICLLLLKGCDLLSENEEQYPEVLRIGNAQSQSNYVFENTENNIYYSSRYAHGKDSHGIDIVSQFNVSFNRANQAPNPTNILKSSFATGIRYFVENPLIPRTEKTKYKNKDSAFYKANTNPATHEHEQLFISSLEDKQVIWYKQESDYEYIHEDYYTIDYDGLYDHILIRRGTNIATVCRVRTMLKEGVQLDFHFSTENSPEEDLRVIDFVVTDLLSRLKPAGGSQDVDQLESNTTE